MGMIDRQMVPLVLVNVAQRVQEPLRLTVVADSRRRVDVGDGIDPQRHPLFAADDAARLARRVGAREGDELLQLLPCQLHWLSTVKNLAADDRLVYACFQQKSRRNRKNVLRQDHAVGRRADAQRIGIGS